LVQIKAIEKHDLMVPAGRVERSKEERGGRRGLSIYFSHSLSLFLSLSLSLSLSLLSLSLSLPFTLEPEVVRNRAGISEVDEMSTYDVFWKCQPITCSGSVNLGKCPGSAFSHGRLRPFQQKSTCLNTMKSRALCGYQRAASSEARRRDEGDDDCRMPSASATTPQCSFKMPS
jgi:hypothetical protein